MTALAPVTGWRAWLPTPVVRALALISNPTEFRIGADYVAEQSVMPTYDQTTAMSAFAAFPWVQACVLAIATDLTGLQITVETNGKPDPKHPLLALLGKPNTHTDGELLRLQLWVDLVCAGNAYVLVLEGTRHEPAALIRLHPARVFPIAGSDGEPIGYEYDTRGDGGRVRYDASTILHVRGASWENGPGSVYGTSPIQALHADLEAEKEMVARERTAAKQGRPSAILTPRDAGAPMSPTQTDQLAEKLREKFRANGGGVVIAGSPLDVTTLDWSVADMAFGEQHTRRRETIMALFGVPPTRLQLPTANYAQSSDAMTQYWETLRGRARLLDRALSRLAARWGGEPVVAHDFSGVTYLQRSRTERLQRVTQHILNGMEPAAAYRYEGFTDAPGIAPIAPVAEPVPAAPVRSVRRAVPMDEESRAAIWRSWVVGQRRTELALARIVSAYLRGSAARVAAAVLAGGERAADGVVTRSLDLDALLGSVFGEAERQRLIAEIGPTIRAALIGALHDVLARLDVSPGSALAADAVASGYIRESVDQILGTSKDLVAGILRQGLDEGWTTQEIAERLQDSAAAFGPARALTIARTESTHALSAGSVAGMQQAEAQGVAVRKQWLSARDGTVRPAHAALDGQTVRLSAAFVVPAGVEHAGAHGQHPGDFSDPSMTCNCRCTVLPVVDEETP